MSFTLEILIFIFVVMGSLGNFFWRRRLMVSNLLYTTIIWWGLLLSVYLVILETLYYSYYFFVQIALFLFFLFSYFQDKRKLVNGLLFNIFFIIFHLYLMYMWVKTSSFVMGIILLLSGAFVFFGFLFGIYSLIIFLYWHGITVKKESSSIRNILTLLLGLYLIIYLLVRKFVEFSTIDWVDVIFSIIPAIIMYFILVFYNFLTVSLLYQLNRPKYNQDYIIVLGAGLLDGERVSPLLAQRIDKAIDFYQMQKQATLHPPKIIMSGGHGSDELLPEAVAMKNYAVSQGVCVSDILIETKSTTTLENMRFSKDIIDQYGAKPYRVIFISNNYHIFRAGLYAKAVNLEAEGIGSKTATYYLPNAFLREFVAIVALRKKQHLIICILIILLFILFSLYIFLYPEVMLSIA